MFVSPLFFYGNTWGNQMKKIIKNKNDIIMQIIKNILPPPKKMEKKQNTLNTRNHSHSSAFCTAHSLTSLCVQRWRTKTDTVVFMSNQDSLFDQTMISFVLETEWWQVFSKDLFVKVCAYIVLYVCVHVCKEHVCVCVCVCACMYRGIYMCVWVCGRVNIHTIVADSVTHNLTMWHSWDSVQRVWHRYELFLTQHH